MISQIMHSKSISLYFFFRQLMVFQGYLFDNSLLLSYLNQINQKTSKLQKEDKPQPQSFIIYRLNKKSCCNKCKMPCRCIIMHIRMPIQPLFFDWVKLIKIATWTTEECGDSIAKKRVMCLRIALCAPEAIKGRTSELLCRDIVILQTYKFKYFNQNDMNWTNIDNLGSQIAKIELKQCCVLTGYL